MIKKYIPLMAFFCLFIVFFGAGPAESDENADFEAWLKKYHAWDLLEWNLSTQNHAPEIILSRATYLLRLNKVTEAKKLLEQNGPFEKQDLEANRLWLLAQCERNQGNYAQALALYLQTSTFFDTDTYHEKCRNEPGLKRFWEDYWLKTFWNSLPAPPSSSMLQAAVTANSIWPQDSLWQYVTQHITENNISDDTGSLSTSSVDYSVISLESGVRSHVLKALGHWSVRDWEGAGNALSRIEQEPVLQFWTTFGNYLRSGFVLQKDLEHLRSLSIPKAVHFFHLEWSGFGANTIWLIPDLHEPYWKEYLSGLSNMPVTKAIERIEMERHSSLIPSDAKNNLDLISISYHLINDDSQSALDGIQRIENSNLPLVFVLGRMILDGDMERTGPLDPVHAEALGFLGQSMGLKGNTSYTLPFWVKISPDDVDTVHEAYPLDKLLSFSLWRRQWEEEQNPELAKRLAFLFPATQSGYNALLFLARHAHKNGETALAWSYLNQIGRENLPREREAEFLKARAGLEMELGWEKRSLKTYELLLERYPEKVSSLQKLILATKYGQIRGKWKWSQEILLSLWEQKEELKPSMQAEILFYLGEGAQQLGQSKQALEYFLTCAWAYPKESKWAGISMYRAALIYEQKGQYETAKRLLTTVIKIADRKSEKKAAQDRIHAINAKMGRAAQAESEDNQEIIYPF